MMKVFHLMFSRRVSKIRHTGVTEHTEGNRSNLNNTKNRHPVPTRPDGLHSGSNPGSVDPGGVEPRHRQLSDSNNELEEKDKGTGTICRPCRSKREQDRNHDETEAKVC